MEPFGLDGWSDAGGGGGAPESGGMVVVVPGAVDESLEGAGVEVSLGGEVAEPPGEVDCCFEHAPRSASEPTHNNRTLRFIGHLTGVKGRL
jgi:hypothetical protein